MTRKEMLALMAGGVLGAVWRVPKGAEAAGTAYSDGYIFYCIDYWADFYALPKDYMAQLAWCESHLNPGAYNPASGASGLFQFMPQTFYGWRDAMNWDKNDTSKLEYRSLWHPAASAHVASYMIAHGQSDQWACSTDPKVLSYD